MINTYQVCFLVDFKEHKILIDGISRSQVRDTFDAVYRLEYKGRVSIISIDKFLTGDNED